MKFSALIGDNPSVEAFTRILAVVGRICKKKCVMRINPDEVCFANISNAREGIYLDVRVVQSEMFASYTMQGIAEEHNSIVFELSTEDLVQSVHVKEESIKLKLTRKENAPHLRVELLSSSVIHEIPVSILAVRQWDNYLPPNTGQPTVAIYLPPVKVVQRIIQCLKNMHNKYMLIKANNAGELAIHAATDSAKFKVCVGDLSNITVRPDGDDRVEPADAFQSVKLDLRVVHSFLSSLHQTFNRASLRLINDRVAIFAVNQADCHITFYVSALTDP
ncbi:Hus1-like protein [Aphelenchoides avenae]|nr:Hus1-like protein [Aphelenchus avenae]